MGRSCRRLNILIKWLPLFPLTGIRIFWLFLIVPLIDYNQPSLLTHLNTPSQSVFHTIQRIKHFRHFRGTCLQSKSLIRRIEVWSLLSVCLFVWIWIFYDKMDWKVKIKLALTFNIFYIKFSFGNILFRTIIMFEASVCCMKIELV